MSNLSKVIKNEDMLKITEEFQRLKEKCYLENAGAALYPKSLLELIHQDLTDNIYPNPHTDNYTKACIDQMRYLVLKHFNADPSIYTVIFTAGSTQALKLVIESFDFTKERKEGQRNGTFAYLRDNHTSVLGMREIAEEKGANVEHVCHDDFLHLVKYNQKGGTLNSVKYKYEENALFVYPAQSNHNGFKYPIHCMEQLRSGCLNSYMSKQNPKLYRNWYIFLDCACYVSTNKLDLEVCQPDFLCLSFYKMFGFPTGLGALLVKKDSAQLLDARRYFGGGTVDMLLSSETFHVKRKEIHERFEDGTSAYLSILALKHCFDVLNKLIPKVINDDVMETISHHTYYLAKDLYEQLKSLRHANGNAAVVLYMDTAFEDVKKQGGIINFNLMRLDGTYIGYTEFQNMANLFNIFLRTGCFCNSGACQRHLNLTNKAIKDMYKAGHVCGDEHDLVNDKPTGSIRVSFGYYNTFNDVDKLVAMIIKCFVKTEVEKPSRDLIKYEDAQNNNSEQYIVTKIENGHNYANSYKKNMYIMGMQSAGELKDIVIYPIKSCGAYKVDTHWQIGKKGFEYDREWMIIRDNGAALTQKQNSRMCMIRPSFDFDRGVLILNFPGKEPTYVSLDIVDKRRSMSSSFCQSKVCSDTIQGYDCGEDVGDWVSEALGISFLRLIRQSDEDQRSQKNKKSISDKTMLSLSNQAQFLLINKATVRYLSSKIDEKLFIDDLEGLTDRFRGNLIVDNDEALSEREWSKIIIGNHKFRVEGPCSRCQMVCIDQRTGEKTVEPLRTISELFAGKMRFGIYLSYIGTVNGHKDNMLRSNLPIKAIHGDADTTR